MYAGTTKKKTYYYAKCFNDNIEELVKKIQPQDLGYTGDEDNEVLLIHCIYDIITSTQLYRREEIQEYIWDKLKLNIVTSEFHSITDFRFSYDWLFDRCWMHRGLMVEDKRGKYKAKKLSKIAYKKRPFYQKLYNSDIALVIFIILTIVGQVLIHNSYDFLECTDKTPMGLVLMTAVVWIWSIALGDGIKKNWAIPLFAFAFMICSSYLYILDPYSINIDHRIEDCRYDIVTYLSQRNIMVGLMFLLWIPILDPNIKRINEIYN